MNQAIVLAVIAAVSGGGMAAIIAGAFQRPKTRAEASKLVADAGEVLDKRWQSWASALEKKVGELETRLTARDEDVRNLQSQLDKEKIVTRLVISWALVMRSEIQRLSGNVPPPPAEVQQYLGEIT